jgi:hypothetical protein
VNEVARVHQQDERRLAAWRVAAGLGWNFMEGKDPKLPASLLAKAFGVRSIAWLDV